MDMHPDGRLLRIDRIGHQGEAVAGVDPIEKPLPVAEDGAVDRGPEASRPAGWKDGRFGQVHSNPFPPGVTGVGREIGDC